MWNHSKSLTLTAVWVKITFCIWVIFAVTAPFIVKQVLIVHSLSTANWFSIMIIIYLVYVPILLILINLNRLLNKIKDGQVFIEDNVAYLRSISWACFFAAIILLAATWYQWWLILFSGIIGFFGLLMRVVKNILGEAVALKEENDYTI